MLVRTPCFLGGVRANAMGSRCAPMGVETVSISCVLPSRSPLSIDLLQDAGVPTAVIGEGSGVRSIIGPTPGEDKAEAGDRETALGRAAPRVLRTLELRTGSPVEVEGSCVSAWLYMSLGSVLAEFSRRVSTSKSVCTRRPALCGVWGDTIVGCACGEAVSRAWSDALYWNGGCKELGNIPEAWPLGILFELMESQSVSLEARAQDSSDVNGWWGCPTFVADI